jgi:hypothetical protein
MARSSHPSLPPTNEPNLQRLGRGSAAGERPLRAQLVIAGVLVLILLAVPVYLLRRPSGSAAHSVGVADAGVPHFGGVILAEVDASVPGNRVEIGPLTRVRCGPTATRPQAEGGLCDALPALEAAFRRSVEGSSSCAPRTGKEGGSINYVLEVDFTAGRLNVFPGKSGKWRGPRARKAATCVLRLIPDVPWLGLPHEHEYYAIAVLATYPGPDLLDVLPSFD